MNLKSFVPLCLSLVAFATGCPSEEPVVEAVGTCADVAPLEGDVFVSNDAALLELDGVVAIRGNLEIRDEGVATLALLQDLRCVGGDVIIRTADRLQSLDGMSALEFVGGSLSIVDNERLGTTGGLGHDLVVEGSLRIAQNPALEDVAVLAFVDSIGGELLVSENPLVTELPRMEALAAVGELRIEYNDALASLEGFAASAVTEVPGRIQVIDNALTSVVGLDNIVAAGGVEVWGAGIADLTALAALERTNFLSVQFTAATDLGGLEKLTQVTERLWIMNNPNMASLAGLDNVRAVDAWVRIENNAALADVSALLGVSQATGELSVRQNPTLPACAVDILATHFIGAGLSGTIDVGGNDDDGVCQ